MVRLYQQIKKCLKAAHGRPPLLQVDKGRETYNMHNRANLLTLTDPFHLLIVAFSHSLVEQREPDSIHENGKQYEENRW